MLPPLRIAILECDEPIGQTKERYGGYGNLFKELLEEGAELLGGGHGGDGVREEKVEKEEEKEKENEKRGGRGKGRGKDLIDVRKYDVVRQEVYPELDGIDAVLITGSRYNSYDNDPWILKLVAFTKKVLEQDRVRLIGVCFGHQIIGRALGVKVDRSDRGWEVSVTTVQLTEQGKKLFGLEELAIHQMHRDIVYEYPTAVEPLGYSPRCDVQGMYAKNRLLTVQGHPEFTGDIVEELLESRHEKGIFDDAMYQDGMARVRKAHDGVVVSAAFLRFLLDD